MRLSGPGIASGLHCGNTRPYSDATDCTHSRLVAQSYVPSVATALIVYLLRSGLITLDSSPNANTRVAKNRCTCSPPPQEASNSATPHTLAARISAARQPITNTFI